MSCPEQLDALEALWRLKSGSGRLPRRSDFSPEELRPWLGNLGLVAVERDGHRLRFRITLSGTVLDQYRGYGVTGRYLGRRACGDESLFRNFTSCAVEGVPVRFIHDNSRNSAVYRRMAQLLLPLGEDGVQVDRILVGLYPLPANDAERDSLSLAG